MGKSAAGAVWLNEERLPVYDFWQFWRNTEDADVGKFMRLFTELDDTEIARLEALEGADINQAKIILANEVKPCAMAQRQRKTRRLLRRKVSKRAASLLACLRLS